MSGSVAWKPSDAGAFCLRHSGVIPSRRIEAVLKGCGFNSLKDIQAEPLQR